MSDETADTEIRVARVVRLDLRGAGHVYVRKQRPAKRTRQTLVRFLGREGDEELFGFEQSFPPARSGDRPASQAQLDSVLRFYGEGLTEEATSFQAHVMLCVRDYAGAVVHGSNFSAARKRLLERFVAAYLSADPKLRDEVRRWNEARHRELGSGISSGIAYDRPYKAAGKFMVQLLDDLRGAGAEAFG